MTIAQLKEALAFQTAQYEKFRDFTDDASRAVACASLSDMDRLSKEISALEADPNQQRYALALKALAESDVTMMRIDEAIKRGLLSVSDYRVQEWLNYRAALRAVVESMGAAPYPQTVPDFIAEA